MMRSISARLGGMQLGSTHRTILTAAASVAFFSFLAKLAGAGKEIFVARWFGTSGEVDAFLIALALPSFAIVVIGTALNNALMPAYIEVRQREGPEAGQRLLSTAMALSILALGVASLLIAVAVPLLLPLFSRFSSVDVALTREMSYFLFPTVVLAGTTMTWTAVLNAHGRFARPAAAALAIPVITVVVLLSFGGSLGIRTLAYGTLVGYAVEMVIVGSAVRREGLSILPRWGGMTESVSRVVREFVPAATGMLFTSLNPVIDQLMAARLAQGSVAALGYGNKLVAFAAGILQVSLGSAVLPHFSKLAAARDWATLRRTIKIYLGAVLAIALPVTVATVALSVPIVRVLFERGAFTPQDTAEVAHIQALYALQLPFRMMSLLLVRFIVATAANRALMVFSIVNATVNISGNYVLSEYLGAPGIALSTSVVYAVSFGMNLWYANRQMQAYLSEVTHTPTTGVS